MNTQKQKQNNNNKTEAMSQKVAVEELLSYY